MNINLTQENLSKALSSVDRIVGNRSELAVLGNVMLTIDNNRLKLSATNLEIGINYWIGCQVKEAGAITVPAHLLTEYIANLPAGNINMKVQKNNLHINTERFNSIINGIDPAEFPSIPVISKKPTLILPTQAFKASISQVVLVASTDDARPVLSGVYVYTEDKNLFLVATDSYRLAEKQVKLVKSPAETINIIVPARTMQELVRMIADRDEQLELIVDENQVMFRLENIELISKLVDGQFPDYKQLIPKEVPTTAMTDVNKLVSVAKVANLFARDNAGSVTVIIDNEDKKIQVKAIASQVGENTAETEAKINGETAQVTLNCRYLSDALSVIKSSQVNLGITGKVNPFMVTPVGETDYTHIIMPLRS